MLLLLLCCLAAGLLLLPLPLLLLLLLLVGCCCCAGWRLLVCCSWLVAPAAVPHAETSAARALQGLSRLAVSVVGDRRKPWGVYRSQARANLARVARGSRRGLHVTCVCTCNLFSKLRIGVNGAAPLRLGLETSRKQLARQNASHSTVCAHVSLNMSLSCFSSVPIVL